MIMLQLCCFLFVWWLVLLGTLGLGIILLNIFGVFVYLFLLCFVEILKIFGFRFIFLLFFACIVSLFVFYFRLVLGSHQVILLNLLLAKTDLLLIHLFLKFDLQILLTNLHDILLLYSFLRFQQITIPIFPYSGNFLIIHF